MTAVQDLVGPGRGEDRAVDRAWALQQAILVVTAIDDPGALAGHLYRAVDAAGVFDFESAAVGVDRHHCVHARVADDAVGGVHHRAGLTQGAVDRNNPRT
ncbi:hypothetical protein D3C86_783610 [compost metagenome]